MYIDRAWKTLSRGLARGGDACVRGTRRRTVLSEAVDLGESRGSRARARGVIPEQLVVAINSMWRELHRRAT